MDAQSTSDAAELIKALDNFVQTLVASFGPGGTIAIFFGLILISIGWRVYNDRRKDGEHREVMEEKERTIQRLSNMNRELRVAVFKEVHGWTDDELERFIVRGEFDDGPSARQALEDKRGSK